MKFRIERAALLRVLGHVQSVVERRNTIPILSNVMIQAGDSSATLTTTDLDIQATETVPVEVAQSGATTVPAQTFNDIIRKMPDGCQIELTADSDKLTLVSGRSRFTLAVLPADDFPLIPSEKLPNTFALPSETLSTLFNRARYAISNEETRYYLNGIFLHTDEESILAVSTDGHRLARIQAPRPAAINDIAGVIIPRKCIGEILKVVDDTDDDVQIGLSETKISFKLGELTYTSKLIDGTYPDYVRVIPTGNQRNVIVDPRALAETIDRVSMISAERTRAVKVNLDRDQLKLSVTSPETGLATESLDVDYSGDPFEIGFNARYLLDALQQNKDGLIELSMNNPSDPILVIAQNRKEDVSVLMPMRT